MYLRNAPLLQFLHSSERTVISISAQLPFASSRICLLQFWNETCRFRQSSHQMSTKKERRIRNRNSSKHNEPHFVFEYLNSTPKNKVFQGTVKWSLYLSDYLIKFIHHKIHRLKIDLLRFKITRFINCNKNSKRTLNFLFLE